MKQRDIKGNNPNDARYNIEYCVVVEAQHNYTDSLKEARDWYADEIDSWLRSGKRYNRPELLARVEYTGNWVSVM